MIRPMAALPDVSLNIQKAKQNHDLQPKKHGYNKS